MRGSAFLPRAVLLFGAALLPAQGKPDPAALVRKMGTAKDNNQRYQAYLALLRSKPPGAIPFLERSLPTFTGPALTYGVSLLRSYPDQAGFPALRRLMKAGPSLLSFYCAETLFRAGEKAALPFLRKALEGASDLSSRISMSARIQGLKDEGIQLVYHNHSKEFEKIDGRYIMDWLLEETDPSYVQAEIDVMWVQYAGLDPASYILKYPGRVPLVHVKDMDENKQFTEVGKGVLDFDSIFDACEKVGSKWYIVEQDVCKLPPLESVRQSYQFFVERGMV